MHLSSYGLGIINILEANHLIQMPALQLTSKSWASDLTSLFQHFIQL